MEEIDRNPNWENNTVIVYTSDQGYFLGEHGYYDKRFMYEEALRSPAVVRYPREIPAGSRVPAHVLLQNIDWAPTILDIVVHTYITPYTNTDIATQHTRKQQSAIDIREKDIHRRQVRYRDWNRDIER